MDQFTMLEKMNSSPEFLLAGKAVRIKSSLDAFNLNTNRLLTTLHAYRLVGEAFIAPDGKRIALAHVEVLRHFFNYATSAISIVDHLVATWEEVYGDREKKPALLEYRSEFRKTESYQLTEGIREYMFHYDMPAIIMGNGAFAVSSASLLKWSKWQKHYKTAYKCLKSFPGIHLHILNHNYRTDLRKLFEKYAAEDEVCLKHEYEIRFQLTKEFNAMVTERVSSVALSMLNRPNCNWRDLEMNLSAHIGAELWKPIAEAPNLAARAEAMIEALRVNEVLCEPNRVREVYLMVDTNA
jgi:hypothetical protein